ncbi:MAG: Ldh family oxidoreductase [Burkholderiales bacterium]
MSSISIESLTSLAASALKRSGAIATQAEAAAKYLVAADAQGLPTHGVARVPTYCGHLRSGRARGDVQPRVIRDSGGTCLVDAQSGLGFEPCEYAVRLACERAMEHGIAFAGVTNSHHCGALGLLLEPAAERKLVAFAFSNAPAAIPAWGGTKALYGTNPVAAIFPRAHGSPIVVDLSLTQVTRGQILLLQREGKPIPAGWGMDKHGNPTTDAHEILFGGSLHAVGGLKGTMLALAVELVCCALTGAKLSRDVQSMHTDEGPPLALGQAFIGIDPGLLAGGDVYNQRVEALIDAMLEEPGVRLPGERRRECEERARREGIEIGEALLAELRALAGGMP